MSTVLFEFATNHEREKFLELMSVIATTFGEDDEQKRGVIIANSMKTIRRDPPIRSKSERRAAVFVAGTQLIDGNVEEMNERFTQEIAVHSANVELREDVGDGKFTKVIRSRKKQQI